MYVLATYGKYLTITLCLGLAIYCIFSYVRIMLKMLFLQWHIFHDVRITFLCGTFHYVRKLRFVFVRHCDVFFILSQLRYLFVWSSYDFWYVRMTLCFGTFELRIEMTWKLRLVFFRHRDVFFITLRLRYLFAWIYMFEFVCFIYMFELRIETTLQLRFIFVRHWNLFFITSQLRYLFVPCSYVF